MTRDADYEKLLKDQMEKVDDLFEIKNITPENAVFEKTEGGFLSMKFDDKDYDRILAYRAFPFTEPDKFISIRDSEAGNDEIGLISDLSDWPANLKDLIEEQLQLRYFVPEILRINNIKEEFGYAYWEVQTDKGDLKFTTSISNPIVRATPTRLFVNDLDKNRYEIKDLYGLSRKEKKMIDLFL